MGRKATDPRYWDGRVAEVDTKGPGYRGSNQIGNPVLSLKGKFDWGLGRLDMINKFLKKIMIFAVIFDIFLLLSEYRIIRFGAFCLGLKTSEIVYYRLLESFPE